MTTTSVVPTTSTTAPLPPERLFFSTWGVDADTPPALRSLAAGGGDLSTTRQFRAAIQGVSSGGGHIAYPKLLSSHSREYTGCGVAGCTETRERTSEIGIAVSGTDGSNERVLTTGEYDGLPSLSRDGRKLTFFRYRNIEHGDFPVPSNLFLLDVPTASLAEVVPPADQLYVHASPSPDGSVLAVVRRIARGKTAVQQLVLITPTGGEVRVLGEGLYSDPVWAPDGGSVAAVLMRFETDAEGNLDPRRNAGGDIWIHPTNGSPPRRLTHEWRGDLRRYKFCNIDYTNLGSMSRLSWSRDGTTLAFLSSYRHAAATGHGWDVALADLVTGETRVVYPAKPATCDTGGTHPAEVVDLFGFG